LLQEHAVTEGERLDHIAAKYLGDPEQFWQLCDATGAGWQDALPQAEETAHLVEQIEAGTFDFSW